MEELMTILKGDNACVAEEKSEELISGIRTLFNATGMMALGKVNILGKEFTVIKPAVEDDDAITSDYEYFGESIHGKAGVNKKTYSMFSSRPCGDYADLVLGAAYTLEMLLTDGETLLMHRGSIDFFAKEHVFWLNYVLDKKYLPKWKDLWDTYLALKDKGDWTKKISPEQFDYYYVSHNDEKYKAYLDILAAEKGMEALTEELAVSGLNGSDVHKSSLNEPFEELRFFLGGYKEFSDSPKEKQVEGLIKMLRAYYSGNINGLDAEDGSESFFRAVELLDCPAVIVRAIADSYELDFWDLWDKVSDVAKRKPSGNTYTLENIRDYDTATEELLFFDYDYNGDDLVYYWTKDYKPMFSRGLKSYFKSLKKSYDKLLTEESDSSKALEYIAGILEYADKTYFNMYVFESFIDESLEKLTDARFMALWKLLDKELHKKRNLEGLDEFYSLTDEEIAAMCEDMDNDLCEENEPASLDDTGDELSDEDKAAILEDMDDGSFACVNAHKNHPGRNRIRRLIALLANRALRESILGI